MSGPSSLSTRAVSIPALSIPALSIRGVSMSYGATSVLSRIDLEVELGEVVVLLGPSGCGKTTLLRLIAGIDRPDDGEIRIDDETVSTPTEHLAPEQRQVGMVFQDGALFPHLSVTRNVGFGLDRSERKSGRRIDEMLELVGLGGLGDRMPDSLSGGQRQRVAIARALAPSPKVLLMDEPFSNLDAVLRTRLRRDVRDLLAATAVTTVFVTHDREEAFSLADRVAVMHDGVLEQTDAPGVVYARPTTRWVASFVGDTSYVPATVVSTDPDGVSSLDTEFGRIDAVVHRTEPGTALEGELVDWMTRPDDLRLVDSDAPVGAGAHGAGMPGVVDDVEFLGGYSLVTVRLESGPTVTVREVGVRDVPLGRGDVVCVVACVDRPLGVAFALA